MLTARQAELLTHIANSIRELGRTPSYESLSKSMRLRSKSGVHRLVAELEERGYVRRARKRSQGITILRLPNGIASTPYVEPMEGMASIPLRGHISTLSPLPLSVGILGMASVPASMVEDGIHYAAKAVGDAIMGVADGDLCILRAQGHASSGDIVVVTAGGGSLMLPYREGMKGVTARLCSVLRRY